MSDKNIDYSRNGKSLLCVPVKLFNEMVKRGTLKERNLSSPLYLFRNLDGSLKRSGYIAFTSNCAILGKTKKLALERYKENFE